MGSVKGKFRGTAPSYQTATPLYEHIFKVDRTFIKPQKDPYVLMVYYFYLPMHLVDFSMVQIGKTMINVDIYIYK